MQIGFDAKRAAQNGTGLGNYSRFIIRLLSQYAPPNKYNLYIPNPKKGRYLNELPKAENIHFKYPVGKWTKFRALWRIFGVVDDIKNNEDNLFHGLSNQLPLSIKKAVNTKSIVTIHDVIFLRYPQYYKWLDRKIYNYKFRRACLDADRIIAVSQCTKNDIVKYYKISPEKIDVVYQGCNPVFGNILPSNIKDKVRESYQLPEKFILYVGSIEERKNLMLLAKALKYLPNDITVVAVGRHTAYADKVSKFLKNNGLQNRLKMFHKVDFKDLPAIYQLSTIFVYPSRFEGFGIPLLEALRSRVPVIGCTGSCLEEAGGPHSFYVSPDNDKELAEVILRLWNNEDLRNEVIAKGLMYAENFSDEKLYESLQRTYDAVLKK